METELMRIFKSSNEYLKVLSITSLTFFMTMNSLYATLLAQAD